MYMNKFTFKQAINIIAIFCCYGGMIGGFVFAIGFIPFSMILNNGELSRTWGELTLLIPMSMLIGGLVGFIPAIMAGIAIVIYRNYLDIANIGNKILFSFVFVISILCSILFCISFFEINSILEWYSSDNWIWNTFISIFMIFSFGLIGGVSSIISGRFAFMRIKLGIDKFLFSLSIL